MRINGLAVLLIGCGTLIILDKLGLGLGSLMGFIIPVALTVLGYISIKNGSKFFGWVLFLIGIISLMSKFSGIIGILIAAGLIYYGVTLLKDRSKVY